VARLPEGEKNRLLVLLARGEGLVAHAELRRQVSASEPAAGEDGSRRTVAELLDAAHQVRQERHRRAEVQRAEAEAERERKRAAARERRLAALSADVEGGWARVEAKIATKKPAEYDAVVAVLEDLQVVAERADQASGFGVRLAELRARHQRKSSLIGRIDRAGLVVGPR
jgi:hypothetical protein